MNKLFRISGILAALLLFAGCATLQGDWEKASQQNNVWAYQSFIGKYPDSEYVKEADNRIDQLRYEKAKAAQNEKDLLVFLKQYPSSRHVSEANKLIEQLAFKQAISEHTCSDFVSRFPNSELAPQVILRLRELRYNDARSAKTTAAYEKFISMYPEGSDSMALQKELPVLRKMKQSEQLGEIALRMAKVPLMRVDKVLPGGAVMTYGGRGMMVLGHPDTLKQDMVAFAEHLKAGADPDLIRIANFVPFELWENGMGYTGPAKRAEVVPEEKGGMTLLEYCKANELIEAIALMKKYGYGK